MAAEDGGQFNSVGGAEWALDVTTGDFWASPAFGRGAWENVTELDTGSRHRVAFLLADDTEPFDFDGDGDSETAPLCLYVGRKKRHGNFIERNGLSGGQLFVRVSDSKETSWLEFNTSGTLRCSWKEIDNSPTGTPSEDGSTGFDEYG